MPLTDTQVKNAKTKAKPYRLPDGKGLYLHVATSGTKTWQYRYKLDGKEKLATLGEYPAMTLSDARQARMEARELVKRGVNVTEHQQARKQAVLEAARAVEAEQAALANTFETVAADWHQQKNCALNPKTRQQKWSVLSNHVFPALRERPVTQISRQELVTLVREVESNVSPLVARITANHLCSVFTHAQNMDWIDANPATNLKSALKPHTITPRKMPSREEMAALLQLLKLEPKMDSRTANPIIQAAMLFTILTAVRRGEASEATWDEIDLDKRLWRIPAKRMKMKRPHTIPLSRQALAVLDFAGRLPGGGKGPVFPSPKFAGKPIAAESMLETLRKTFRMDFDLHGFRSFHLTEANNLGVFPARAVGAGLAHRDGGDGFQSDAVYDRGDYLEQRVKIMQWYGDWLEAMQKSGKVEEPADYLPPELRRGADE